MALHAASASPPPFTLVFHVVVEFERHERPSGKIRHYPLDQKPWRRIYDSKYRFNSNNSLLYSTFFQEELHIYLGLSMKLALPWSRLCCCYFLNGLPTLVVTQVYATPVGTRWREHRLKKKRRAHDRIESHPKRIRKKDSLWISRLDTLLWQQRDGIVQNGNNTDNPDEKNHAVVTLSCTTWTPRTTRGGRLRVFPSFVIFWVGGK